MAGVVQNRARVAISSFVLFCAALFLTSYSSKHPSVAGYGSLIVNETLRPLQLLLRGTSQRITGSWDDYVALRGVQQENKLLKERLQALEDENSKLLEWQNEIKRLRDLLQAAEDSGLKGVAANVIGYDPSNWVQAITVDKGSSQGVQLHMPAIKGNAVVGQVIAVSPNSSRILLIVDHSSGVDSIIQSSRVRGVVEGLGREGCELSYVLEEEEIAIGDRVITSGMDGIYPRGLMVGVISDVEKRGEGLFQSIVVKPAVSFSRIETVFIVTEIPAARAETAGTAPLPKKIGKE